MNGLERKKGENRNKNLRRSGTLTVGEQISDRMDFLDANRLRVENGRNPGEQPRLRLMKGRTAVAQKVQNSENDEKAQRTHKR